MHACLSGLYYNTLYTCYPPDIAENLHSFKRPEAKISWHLLTVTIHSHIWSGLPDWLSSWAQLVSVLAANLSSESSTWSWLFLTKLPLEMIHCYRSFDWTWQLPLMYVNGRCYGISDWMWQIFVSRSLQVHLLVWEQIAVNVCNMFVLLHSITVLYFSRFHFLVLKNSSKSQDCCQSVRLTWYK